MKNKIHIEQLEKLISEINIGLSRIGNPSFYKSISLMTDMSMDLWGSDILSISIQKEVFYVLFNNDQALGMLLADNFGSHKITISGLGIYDSFNSRHLIPSIEYSQYTQR